MRRNRRSVIARFVDWRCIGTLMAVLLFILVRAAPRAFATAYQSALNLAHGFSAAQSHGDVLGVVASAGQLLLLAFPTLGLAYTLVLLVKAMVDPTNRSRRLRAPFK